MYLLFGLCFLYHLSAHFDARCEDGSGEVYHVDALEMAHLLSRWRGMKQRPRKKVDAILSYTLIT
jgi:hypothetical protein